MGCQMLVALDSTDPDAADLLRQVPVWFEDWEQKFSRFRPDSELSILNRAGGRTLRVSTAMWEVLQRASEGVEWSSGLVMPTLLAAMEAAGYDRTFDALGQGPVRAETKAGTAVMPLQREWRVVEWHAHTRSICLPPAMRLDLGGIAKGWCAEEAVQRLAGYGPALVDAGGDIVVSGPMASGERWPIAVADPASPDKQLELLMLGGGAVATSGKDYRRWQHDGEWQHHIIDPRTGRSAETDVLSATVIAPSASQAEVAAKVVLILGSSAGLEWLEAHRTLAGLVVLDDDRVLQSNRLKDYVWS